MLNGENELISDYNSSRHNSSVLSFSNLVKVGGRNSQNRKYSMKDSKYSHKSIQQRSDPDNLAVSQQEELINNEGGEVVRGKTGFCSNLNYLFRFRPHS